MKEFDLLCRKYGYFSWVRETYEVPSHSIHVNLIKISPIGDIFIKLTCML